MLAIKPPRLTATPLALAICQEPATYSCAALICIFHSLFTQSNFWHSRGALAHTLARMREHLSSTFACFASRHCTPTGAPGIFYYTEWLRSLVRLEFRRREIFSEARSGAKNTRVCTHVHNTIMCFFQISFARRTERGACWETRAVRSEILQLTRN